MAPSSTSRRKPSHIGHQRNPAGRWLVGVTVAVIVGIGIAFGVTWHSRTTPTSDVGFTYATRSGEHVRITLRDGTTVTLAPDTRLSLSADFGRATRSVTLTGEAYFEVPNAARVPFVVGSGGIATRVLGTAFTVRRYETENTAQVTVFSGKVVSHNHDAFVTISAGRIAYISDSSATTTAIADVHTYMDWPAHRLVFRDAPIGEMLSTVGRWYGYTFTLADSAIARGNVSTTFDVTDANEALLMIRSLLGVTMRFNGTTITLAPGRRSQAPPRRMDVTKPLMEMGR